MLSLQIAAGWAFPNALLQHALADLESCSIDIERFQRKRDRMVNELRSYGYEVHSPEGTFYLWCRWPGDPDRLFDALADRNVFVMPGSLLGSREHFRISLTASDEMVERAIPHFAAATKSGW